MKIKVKVKVKENVTRAVRQEMFASIDVNFSEFVDTWEHMFTQKVTHTDAYTHTHIYAHTHTQRERGDDYKQKSEKQICIKPVIDVLL